MQKFKNFFDFLIPYFLFYIPYSWFTCNALL
jgi:hypothetical protein